MIVLDTDVLIEIFDKESSKGDEALNRIRASGQAVAITSINFHEIMYGLAKYSRPVSAVAQLPVISFTKEDASLSSRIELQAGRKGMAVRRTDAMIAAIAIMNGASLYSLDSHFETIESLKVGLKLFARS